MCSSQQCLLRRSDGPPASKSSYLPLLGACESYAQVNLIVPKPSGHTPNANGKLARSPPVHLLNALLCRPPSHHLLPLSHEADQVLRSPNSRYLNTIPLPPVLTRTTTQDAMVRLHPLLPKSSMSSLKISLELQSDSESRSATLHTSPSQPP